VHVVRQDGSVLRAGRATLHVLAGVGWRRTARLLALPPLVWGVELGYRLVAGNRSFFSRFFRKRDTGCTR
jgi:predicted DCC family thiol-disulfide oxidoreductase YuxK